MKSEYIKHRIDNIFPINKIVTIHYFEFDPDFGSKTDRHDFWELIYVDKGLLLTKSGEQTLTLSQGECFFHKPGELHSHHANGRVAPNIFIISFVCNSKKMETFASKKITVPGHLRPVISGIITEGKRTFDLPFNDPDLKELRVLPDEVPGGQQLVRIYLEQFLILLLRHLNDAEKSSDRVSRSTTREPVPKHMAQDIALRLDSMAYSQVSIDTLCREMRYSRAYLSKIFFKSYGCTMGDYITEVKINEAKKLIREHRYNISQIADLLMYSGPFYFSRVFKKVTGMSPSQYKKSVKID